MSLFEVKGWDVPARAATVTSHSQKSRKRKRASDDTERVQSAQVNVEKLMHKVFEQEDSGREGSKRRRKDKHRNAMKHIDEALSNKSRSPAQTSKEGKKKARNRKEESVREEPESTETSSPCTSKKAFTKSTEEHSPKTKKPIVGHSSALKHDKKPADATLRPSGLTSLQASMKDRLDGSRFRWINEMLYTTGSEEGHRIMREDPKIYEEYHAGFRQQVRSWPSNPVTHYISALSSYPPGTVIADLGCGDAALARSLVPKGYCVISFDLVSDDAFILEADVCDRIPLPGAEGAIDDHQGQIVHVCVCALSLMSVDWIQCIRETWRILRPRGELKIAEVTSRFTDVKEFVSIITSLGFRLKSKDFSNTHFSLFDFQKTARQPITDEGWKILRRKNTVLKPCEYKRR